MEQYDINTFEARFNGSEIEPVHSFYQNENTPVTASTDSNLCYGGNETSRSMEFIFSNKPEFVISDNQPNWYIYMYQLVTNYRVSHE
jgi:hypothetical protein